MTAALLIPPAAFATTLTFLPVTRQNAAAVPTDPPPAPNPAPAGLFPATPWSQLMRLRGDDVSARAALGRVCQMYWYPVYAHIRGRGYAPHDAEDHTQGFFLRLLERRDLDGVDRGHGRLRSFILASVKNYLNYTHRQDSALKRGGGHETVPLDVPLAEEKLGRELVQPVDPERLFEQRWALTLLENVLDELGREYARGGKADVFEALRGFLSWRAEPPGYAEAAASLGVNEQAARVAVHRLRKRYRDLLQKHLAATVDDPAEVDAELDHLLTVFATPR